MQISSNGQTYAPRVYPNELLISAAARFIDHTLNKEGPLTRELVGSTNNTSHFLFPQIQKRFLELLNVTSDSSFKELLHLHSTLPFYKHFLSEKWIQKISHYMDPGITKTVTRFSSPPISFNVARFCPLCIEDDRNKYGETYWHREHCLPEVSTCTIHGCFLQNWVPKLDNRIKGKIYSANRHIQKIEAPRYNTNSNLKALDRILLDLLNSKSTFNRQELISLAEKKGLIMKVKLKYYTDKHELSKFKFFASTLGGVLNINKIKKGHFTDIFNDQWTGSIPSLYILLMIHLRKLENQNSNCKRISIACVNKYCSELSNQSSDGLVQERINRKGTRVICRSCNMVYFYNVNTKKIRILHWGSVVESIVGSRLKAGYSIFGISKEVGISREIIEKIADSSYKNKYVYSGDTVDALRKTYRKKWLDELNSDHFESVKISGNKNQSIYKWLLKFDNVWIRKINKKYRKRNWETKSPDYYKSIDGKFVTRLMKAKEAILKSNNRRITYASLASAMNKGILGCKDKLPLSTQFIRENIESWFDFKKRRLTALSATIKRKNLQPPTKSHIYQKFSLRSNSVSEQNQLYKLVFK